MRSSSDRNIAGEQPSFRPPATPWQAGAEHAQRDSNQVRSAAIRCSIVRQNSTRGEVQLDFCAPVPVRRICFLIQTLDHEVRNRLHGRQYYRSPHARIARLVFVRLGVLDGWQYGSLLVVDAHRGGPPDPDELDEGHAVAGRGRQPGKITKRGAGQADFHHRPFVAISSLCRAPRRRSVRRREFRGRPSLGIRCRGADESRLIFWPCDDTKRWAHPQPRHRRRPLEVSSGVDEEPEIVASQPGRLDRRVARPTIRRAVAPWRERETGWMPSGFGKPSVTVLEAGSPDLVSQRRRRFDVMRLNRCGPIHGRAVRGP